MVGRDVDKLISLVYDYDRTSNVVDNKVIKVKAMA